MLCESDNYTKDIAAPIGSNGLPQIWDDSEGMYFATGPISTTFTDDMPLLDRVNMKRPKTEYYVQQDDGPTDVDEEEWDFNKCMWVKYGCASTREETEDAEDPWSDDDVEDAPEVEKDSETDSDDNEGSGVESGETESDEE